MFPNGTHARTLLVVATLSVTALVWVGQALGSVGLLARSPIVVTTVVLCALTYFVTGRSTPAGLDTEQISPRRTAWRWPAFVAGGAVVLVGIRWLSRILEPFPNGIAHADVLHYHGPMAAIWAQTEHTWPVSFWSVGDASAYHPGNAELLHALGMVLFGNDLASFVINLPFLAVALVAGWSVGARRGNGPAGVLVVASVFTLQFMTAEAGQILNDAMPLTFVIVAAALLDEAHAHRDRDPARFLVVAGLAAGLAVGAKLTVIVAVISLALGAAVSERRRIRAVLCYALPALSTGGYWYVRNLVSTGSPIPAFQRGPFDGPSFPELTKVEHSVVGYARDSAIWHDYFLPGLRSSLGPWWPVILLLPIAAAGAVSISRRTIRADPIAATLGLVALLTAMSYLVNPASAAGNEGDPWVFRANVRYLFPALILGGLAVLGHTAARRRPTVAVGAASLLFVASSLYTPDLGNLALASAGAFVAVGSIAIVRHIDWARPAIAVLAIAVVGLGFVAQREYFARRWTDTAPPRWEIYAAARDLHDVRIAVTGQPQSYPFYGSDLDNEVWVIGHVVDDVYEPIDDCEDWWRAVEAFDADYVAVLSHPKLLETELGRRIIIAPATWLDESNASVVAREAEGILYDVHDAMPVCA